jgi:hypothetical protein
MSKIVCINCKNFVPNLLYTDKTNQLKYGLCKLITVIDPDTYEIRFNYAKYNLKKPNICGENLSGFKENNSSPL